MNYNQQHRPTGPKPFPHSPAPVTVALSSEDLHLAAGLVAGFSLGVALAVFSATLAILSVLR